MKTRQTTPAAGRLETSRFVMAGLLMVGALQASAGEIRPTKDDQLRRAAAEAVRTNPFLGVFDQVLVEVNAGHVRLWGFVEHRQRREMAAARVARVPGVLDVRNDIEVQSSAPEDVMLRRRIFERLYYGGGVEPSLRPEWPVRIVVNDGRVTLTGELVDSASREQLETMAWSAGARFVETRLQAPTGSLPMASAQR